MPAAINKGIYVAISKINTNSINLFALDLDDNFTTEVNNNYQLPTKDWPNYIIYVMSIEDGVRLVL